MNLSRIEQIPAVKAVGIRMLTVHQQVYERTGGLIGHRILGVPSLLLHTVGAKTGMARTNALSYARDGATYLVVASMGGAPTAPGWYHNLKARPEAEIQIARRHIPVASHAVFPGEADFERLWELVNKHNADRYRAYQRATSRPIPVVVLTPR
ncbi:nitroreductase family deazaflavin-dependent oxidoreductase [Jatrophihabitans sp.]|uniref:nitroreductase family deazaflavin-dependent oxidoreductase n=1 Tax=Jatrophihabitans sp. TaxID=1932789 RepID=UPI0030C6F451|nr:nitroreductase [Jatrophihabitans sp.]